ncbi:MAG TPA: hypothetical protein VIS47_03495 [Nitrosopumilus sp.]
MNVKDKLNKISGIIALGMFGILVLGYIMENDVLIGFPNAMVLYGLLPAALIWFGTRKNGCGSCNQTCEITDPDKELKK